MPRQRRTHPLPETVWVSQCEGCGRLLVADVRRTGVSCGDCIPSSESRVRYVKYARVREPSRARAR